MVAANASVTAAPTIGVRMGVLPSSVVDETPRAYGPARDEPIDATVSLR
jgi:hypothetical protein